MRTAILTGCLLAAASAAFAQTVPPAPPAHLTPSERSEKLPVFVVDARIVYPMMGQDELSATALGYTKLEFPGRALGYGFGLHLYPVRGQLFSFGVGGEYVFVRATDQRVDPTTEKPIGPELTRRLQSLSGLVSINFGRGDGWSYLSAGMGPLVFDNFYSTLKRDGPSQMTLNFGGGARWFNTDHLAFSMDLRIYMTKAAKATANTAARNPKKMLVISGGIAIK